MKNAFRLFLGLLLFLLGVGILSNIHSVSNFISDQLEVARNTATGIDKTKSSPQTSSDKNGEELNKVDSGPIFDEGIKFTYGSKVSWSSCKAIPYVLSKGTTESQAELVASALKTMGGSRGLSFAFAGYSKKIAHQKWGEELTKGEYRPVLISFVKPAQTDLLGKNNAGGAVVNRSGEDSNLYVSGTVAFNLNTFNNLKDGFVGGKSKGNLLLHEFGHLIGLEHVKKTSALMNPNVNDGTENGLNDNELSSLRSFSATCKD